MLRGVAARLLAPLATVSARVLGGLPGSRSESLEKAIARQLTAKGGSPENMVAHRLRRDEASRGRVTLCKLTRDHDYCDITVCLMLYIPSDLQCDFVSLHLGSNAAAVHVEGRDEWQSLVLRASAPAALNIEIIVHNMLPRRGFLYTASLEVSTSKASVASDDVMLRYEVVTCDRLASLIDGVAIITLT